MKTRLPALVLGCLSGLLAGAQSVEATDLSATAGKVTAVASQERHRVRVVDSGARLPDWVRQASAGLDYGRFRWLDVDATELAMLRTEGIDAQVRARPFELDLGGHRFDPLRDGAPSPTLTRNWLAAEGADWRLVQFHGPIRQAWLDALSATGVQPVQYVYPHTYIVWAEPAAMQRSAALAHVRWQGEFLPDYRLAPSFRTLSADLIEAVVVVRRGLDGLAEAVQAAGAQLLEHGGMDLHLELLQVRIASHRLPELATVAGVYSVQPVATDGGTRSEMSAQINSHNVDGSGVVFPGYLDYLEDLGVDGSGVIMACVDNGTQINHPDLSGRMLSCTGPSCGTGSQADGHGTHVAGIMAGDGASGNVNSGGFLRGLGMAPGANLIEQRYGLIGGPTRMRDLMRDSVRNGATISNNSWGPAGSPVGYDANTRQTDLGVRDADVDAEGDQPLTYVLAIMNGLGGTSTQGSPDEAKNVFTIGAAWAQTNANTQDMRNDEISANSGHGPALDGRFIPHMIANSRFTDSPIGSTGYGMQGGTSQAAPHVAGASALFTEYYRKQTGTEPSPALIKAAFLAVTQDLVGNNDANDNPIGARPDSKQGWGRMQTTPVLAPELPVIYFDQEYVFTDTGDSLLAQFDAADPEQPMRLMLVWTDAAGHGLGGNTPAWNNDLDLRVTADGELYLGNQFVDGWSATGGSADHRNNTEGVFLQPAQHNGRIEVEVLAADINSNALPNAGEGNSQDFVLVCYNCLVGEGAAADLGVALTDVPDPVNAGATLTYVVQVVNFGPDASDQVEVELQLPAEVDFSATRTLPSDGEGDGEWSCIHTEGLVSCSLLQTLTTASLAPTLEIDAIVAITTPPGSIEATVVVAGEWPDPVPENNSASASTEVIASADLIFVDGFECAARGPDC